MTARSLKGGRYEIRKILSQGATAVVFHCYDTVARREVALKVFRDAPDSAALEVFHRECQALAGMRHPNIAEILDAGELEGSTGNRPYIAMPLLEGAVLEEAIRGSGPRLSVERVLEVLCQACRGLQAAHERGVVHGHIEPGSLFLLGDGTVKILGFGRQGKGTLAYRAPEQVRSEAPTARADIFSLAVVGYEALALRRPFEGGSELEIAQAILHTVQPLVSDVNPAVDRAIGEVIQRAMAKEPRQRFADAREFAVALEKAARGEGLRELAGELQSLVEQGREACRAGRFDEGMGLLRRAFEMDRRSRIVRAALVEVMANQARAELDANPERAADLVQAVLALDPAHAEAGRLRALIEERMRPESPPPVAPVEPAERIPTPAPSPAAAAPAAAPRRTRMPLWALVAAVAVVAAVVAGVLLLRGGAAEVALDVRTFPPGATVLINQEARGTSNCRLLLPVGEYEVQAVMPGFRPAVASLTLREGVPGVVDLTLEPLNVALRIFTDLDPARVTINDQPPVPFQGGQFVLDRLPEGRHTVRIAGRYGEAVFPVEVTAAEAPRVAGPVEAKQVAAVVVAQAGAEARVYSSMANAPVSVDGAPAGIVGPEGLALAGLAAGGHELEIGEGRERRKLSFETAGNPTLTAFLNSDRDAGTLVVITGEDGATVWLDGKEQPRPTSRGQLRIPNLAVKQYAVRVTKDGFVDSPELPVEIRKGEDSRLVFELRPVPTVAAMLIAGGPPGAEVLIDGSAVGTVGFDGGFSISNIAPGDHRIELRMPQYRPRVVARQFAAGETVRLSAAEVALEAMPRTAPKPAPPPVAAAPAPPPKTTKLGMEGWAKPGVWRTEGPWHMHRGGGFVLFRPMPEGATYIFTVMAHRGGRLRWVVGHAGDKNHALFEMDDRQFYRKQVTNGRTKELAKKPHGIPRQRFLTCTVQVKVSPESVVHRINVDGTWRDLDEWTDAEAAFTAGPFGFLVRGRDEIGLSNFSVTPAR